jgi:predicted AAA+ superfamily ATPase
MQLREKIISQNNHWNSRKVEALEFKRDIYAKIWSDIDLRLMSLLTGPRRVGKSIILKQLMNDLIVQKKVNPKQILFFEFSPNDNAEMIFDVYNLYKKEFENSKERTYLIFDEIQYIEGYESIIKNIYDNTDNTINTKIVLTGSLSLSYKKRMQDSLAGRFFNYKVSYLNFTEYLSLKNDSKQNEFIEAVNETDRLRKKYLLKDLNTKFRNFLEFGRFPEIVNFDPINARSYIQNLTNQSLNQDVYSYFKIAKPQILNGLFNYIKDNNGGEISVNKLGSLLGASNPTVSLYLDILELMGLARFVYNSTNPLIKLNSTKKAYVNSSFSLLDSKLDIGTAYGFAVESYVLERLVEKGKEVTFWRERQKEIDFLIPKENVGYEVKFRSDPPEIKHKLKNYKLSIISLNEDIPACLF